MTNWSSRLKIELHRLLDLMASPPALRAVGEPLFWLLGRRKGDKFSGSHVRSILVVRTDGLGDMVLMTPFLRELRTLFPQARISLYTAAHIGNLLGLCPYVDEVIFDNQLGLKRNWERVLAVLPAIGKLLPRRFDLAIQPRWDVDHNYSTSVTYLSGARWRVGYSSDVRPSKSILNPSYDTLFTHVILDTGFSHEVERNLHLISEIGGTPDSNHLEVWLDDYDESFATNLLSAHCKSGERVWALGVGGAHRFRRWPQNRFEQLANWIVEEYKVKLLLIGTSEDALAFGNLARSSNGSIINCVGQTTVRQCAALLKRCQCYIGNDTGPMHIAATLGLPIVGIFTSAADVEDQLSMASRYAPWQADSIMLRPPSGLGPCADPGQEQCVIDRPHCILQITVDDVKDAIRTIMRSRFSAPTDNGGVWPSKYVNIDKQLAYVTTSFSRSAVFSTGLHNACRSAARAAAES